MRDGVPDFMRVAFKKRPPAFLRLGIDGPTVSCETGDDMQMEVKDGLERDLAITDQDIDPLTVQT